APTTSPAREQQQDNGHSSCFFPWRPAAPRPTCRLSTATSVPQDPICLIADFKPEISISTHVCAQNHTSGVRSRQKEAARAQSARPNNCAEGFYWVSQVSRRAERPCVLQK